MNETKKLTELNQLLSNIKERESEIKACQENIFDLYRENSKDQERIKELVKG